MNKEEALIYIWDILEQFCYESQDDEAQILLSEMDPNPIRLNTGAKTADPAVWDDWIEAIGKITPGEYLTETEARKALVVLMEEYNAHHGFRLQKAIEYINNIQSA